MKTIIIQTSPTLECFTTFKGLCEAKGWVYQTLANAKKVPTVGKHVTVDGCKLHRVEVKKLATRDAMADQRGKVTQ